MRLVLDFFKEAMLPFDSAAILTAQGDLVDLKYETLADIGTLSTAANMVIRYLPMKMGDLAIVNDPYSGGTILSTMTLVTPLTDSYFFAFRVGFRPRLVITNSIEEEGLRIPPTPIGQNRKLNPMILEAIEKHPLCPENFSQKLEHILPLVWKRIDTFNFVQKKNPLSTSSLFQKSRNYFSQVLSELPTGDCKLETRLDSGELIKLHLSLSADRVICDFSGTSSSQRLAMTDSSTIGACFGALLTFCQKSVPINTGSLSLLQLNTPLGCLLNAKYPSPTFRGMTEGTSVVAGMVIKALTQITKDQSQAESATLASQIGIEFSNGKIFFDSLPGGTGANSKGAGVNGIHYWIRNRLQNSVQEIEQRFPLLIHQIAYKSNSGGRGLHAGGHGLIKEYEVLEPATLHWVIPGNAQIAQGAKGGSSGSPAEIQIIKPSGEKLPLSEREGKMPLHPHDRISLTSAGGGGWGK